MIKDAFKSAAKIIAIVVVLLILIGTGCINSLMFHPVKGKYNATTRGYVDIGTNGVKVAAIVYGPEHGSPPSQGLRRGSPPSQGLRRGSPPFAVRPIKQQIVVIQMAPLNIVFI